MSHLDFEETELLTSYDRGDWKPISDVARESARYQQYATNQGVNPPVLQIDLTPSDFALLQERGRETGLTEESIIVRLVQGYVSGQITLPT